jgi:hypothetical protein
LKKLLGMCDVGIGGRVSADHSSIGSGSSRRGGAGTVFVDEDKGDGMGVVGAASAYRLCFDGGVPRAATAGVLGSEDYGKSVVRVTSDHRLRDYGAGEEEVFTEAAAAAAIASTVGALDLSHPSVIGSVIYQASQPVPSPLSPPAAAPPAATPPAGLEIERILSLAFISKHCSSSSSSTAPMPSSASLKGIGLDDQSLGLWASKEQLLGALEVLGLRGGKMSPVAPVACREGVLETPVPELLPRSSEVTQEVLLQPHQQEESHQQQHGPLSGDDSSSLSSSSSLPALDPAVIRSSGRRLSRMLHPDKCKLPRAADAFAEVNAASCLLLQHVRQITLLGGPGAADVSHQSSITAPAAPTPTPTGAASAEKDVAACPYLDILTGANPSPASAANVTPGVTRSVVTSDSQVTGSATVLPDMLSPGKGSLVPFQLPVPGPMSDRSKLVLQALELNPGLVAAAGLDMKELLPEWLTEDPQPPLLLLVHVKKGMPTLSDRSLLTPCQIAKNTNVIF